MADTLSLGARLRELADFFIAYDARSEAAKQLMLEAAAELDRREARLTALADEVIALVEGFQAPGARAGETTRIGGLGAVSQIRTALRAHFAAALKG